MTVDEKYDFLFSGRGDKQIRFITYRKENDQTISLYDCGDIFIEMYALKNDKKPFKIEAIDLYDNRIDLYIDYAEMVTNQDH